MLSRGVLQSVQMCINQYLNGEQEAMEERIRAFIENEQANFERKRAEVKMQKADLLRFLVQNGGGFQCGESGTMDEDFDGALPLSPLSIASGDPSPGLTAMIAMNGTVGGEGIVSDGNYILPTTPSRPKSFSVRFAELQKLQNCKKIARLQNLQKYCRNCRQLQVATYLLFFRIQPR